MLKRPLTEKVECHEKLSLINKIEFLNHTKWKCKDHIVWISEYFQVHVSVLKTHQSSAEICKYLIEKRIFLSCLEKSLSLKTTVVRSDFSSDTLTILP
jgi:hypothetical protein